MLFVRASSLIVFCCLLLTLSGPPSAAAQEDISVQELIERMTVEEKVGQLFLVSFTGRDVSSESAIARLIAEYNIGGVVLSPANGNFTNTSDTPRQVAQLTNALQALSAGAVETEGDSENYVPLLIAAEQEGDGYPHTAIRGGVTAVPNNMALGATWNPENAEEVGAIVGKQLAALGVNVLLGPSLDVLHKPRPGGSGDLGGRTFGGDPYWVGQFGQAYIRGVHRGAEGRIAVVAKHFPGNGASDRSVDEEVATVDKSLQELRRIELPPFFAVTRQEAEPGAVADALMTTHIRYRGFQGNIRQRTRPISFDAQGLGAIMGLPEFEAWRQEGGILMSGELGVPAVRKYYDPRLENFPFKRIAQDAFLAGNDLLLLSHFALTDDWSTQVNNIQATVQFFREKYASDPTFQARVDEALMHILKLKYRLYPSFSLQQAKVNSEGLTGRVGGGGEEIALMAQEAATLIHPGAEELADRLPSPPASGDNIVIFVDDRRRSDCAECPSFSLIEPGALESVMYRLYGPAGTGQIDEGAISTITFSQLKDFLAASERGEASFEVRALIEDADWLLFSMLDVNKEAYPASDALKAFLRHSSESLRNKKIVALSYSAPYYLDSTEISKLTAYFAFYSKIPAFIEASARLLFQEFTAAGAPPVSVEGLNYELIRQTEANPNQVLQVMQANQPAEEEATAPLDVEVGDILELVTAPIMDKNGNPVPDGTPVTFRLFYPAESLELPRKEVTTVDGVARTVVTLDRVGRLEITASSDPAFQSTKLVVTIQGDEPATIVTVIPTQPPTPKPTNTPTPVPSPTPTATATATLPPPTATATVFAPSEEEPVPPVGRRPDWTGLLLALTSIGTVGSVGYFVGRNGGQTVSEGLRFSLWSLIGGLIGYVVWVQDWLGLRVFPYVGALLAQILPAWSEPLIIGGLLALLPLVALLVLGRWPNVD